MRRKTPHATNLQPDSNPAKPTSEGLPTLTLIPQRDEEKRERGHLLLRFKVYPKMLREEAIPSSLDACEIVPAQLGESIGDFGALATAL